MVTPADHLLQPANRRFNRHVMRERMRPGADQPFARTLQPGQQTRHGFRIIVSPAGHRKDRDGDPGKILGHRPLFPEIITALVAEPCVGPGLVMGDPGQPHRAPCVANNHRVGRQVVVGEHRGGPVEIILGQTAADPMDIGGIAVVGGPDGDDGFQGRRLMCCNLQPVEPTPADPVHRDLPVAPPLGGQPGNRGDAIALFLLGILVVDQPLAVARAANVQPDAGIAMPRQIAVHRMIATARALAFAVGQIFQNGGNCVGGVGQPQRRCQANTVGHRDEDILHQPHGKGKVGHDPWQGGPPSLLVNHITGTGRLATIGFARGGGGWG